jgi:hypothetical protein
MEVVVILISLKTMAGLDRCTFTDTVKQLTSTNSDNTQGRVTAILIVRNRSTLLLLREKMTSSSLKTTSTKNLSVKLVLFATTSTRWTVDFPNRN